MDYLNFTDPGVLEYLIVLIVAGIFFITFFTIWFAHHTQSNQVRNIVDKIRARGPVSTIHLDGEGGGWIELHKTPDNIRQEIAEDYGVRLDQVTHCGGGKYKITQDPVLTA